MIMFHVFCIKRVRNLKPICIVFSCKSTVPESNTYSDQLSNSVRTSGIIFLLELCITIIAVFSNMRSQQCFLCPCCHGHNIIMKEWYSHPSFTQQLNLQCPIFKKKAFVTDSNIITCLIPPVFSDEAKNEEIPKFEEKHAWQTRHFTMYSMYSQYSERIISLLQLAISFLHKRVLGSFSFLLQDGSDLSDQITHPLFSQDILQVSDVLWKGRWMKYKQDSK